MQADWAKKAPVADYVPPEDYEPRDDKYLQWIKSLYGDASDSARAGKLERLLRSADVLRNSEPDLKLPEKLHIEIHHEYDTAVQNYAEWYGPLNKYHVTCNSRFDWIDGPWPWEGGME